MFWAPSFKEKSLGAAPGNLEIPSVYDVWLLFAVGQRGDFYQIAKLWLHMFHARSIYMSTGKRTILEFGKGIEEKEHAIDLKHFTFWHYLGMPGKSVTKLLPYVPLIAKTIFPHYLPIQAIYPMFSSRWVIGNPTGFKPAPRGKKAFGKHWCLYYET